MSQQLQWIQRKASVIGVLMGVLLLSGCAAQGTDTRPLPAVLPAEFAGMVSCADCPDADWRLQLYPDQLFLLRKTRLDATESGEDRFGRWLLSSDGRTLALHGKGAEPLTLTVPAADRLLVESADGAAQPLDRTRRLRPLNPTLALQGMYEPAAAPEDFARFEECQTGQQLRVMPGEEAEQMAALFAQEQQLSAPVGDPQRLMMSVTATLDLGRAGGTEATALPSMQVERVERAWPDLKCEPRVANAPLIDTYWRLVETGGYELPEGEYRPPFLRFEEGGRLAGSTGCNRLGGTYRVDGTTLLLGELAATRMSCRGTAVIEQMVTDLLRQVASWKILGHTLELFDASGALLGRFEARSDQ